MRKVYLVSLIVAGVFASPIIHSGSSDTSEENSDVAATKPVLLHALTNKPLTLDFRPDQAITDAVAHFLNTGENQYAGDTDALIGGKKVYQKLCQACHLKDGTGRIGPNLTDDTWTRERTNTQVGRFEIIYGGGAGAMQAFGRRIDQDDILKVMAFIDTL